jgi:hypothetical protein
MHFWRECEKGQEISQQQQFLSTKPRESRQISVHFSSLQFVKNNFPAAAAAAAVVSIHKCHLADQQASIGSQLAVNDRIASFEYWSGVEWSGVDLIASSCAILDILMEFWGVISFFGLRFGNGSSSSTTYTFCLVHWLNEFAQLFLMVSLANLLMWSSLFLQLHSSVSVLPERVAAIKVASSSAFLLTSLPSTVPRSDLVFVISRSSKSAGQLAPWCIV